MNVGNDAFRMTYPITFDPQTRVVFNLLLLRATSDMPFLRDDKVM